MRNSDMSLPQIVDLAADQRQRAAKALEVLRRQLKAQHEKADRMERLIASLEDRLADGEREKIPADQLEAHKEAAREELRTAQEIIDKLKVRERDLSTRLEEKRHVEESLTRIYEERKPRLHFGETG